MLSLELGILTLELIADQRVRVHDHLVLLNFQDYEARHRFLGQGAKGPSHRPRVDEVDAIQGAEFELVGVASNQHLNPQFDCFVRQSFLVSPGDDLMPVHEPQLHTGHLDNLLLGEVFDALVFEVALDGVEVAGQGLGPVVNFPAPHVPRADDRIDFIGGDHLPIFGRHLGSAVGDVEVAQQQHQHAHLLLLGHDLSIKNYNPTIIDSAMRANNQPHQRPGSEILVLFFTTSRLICRLTLSNWALAAWESFLLLLMRLIPFPTLTSDYFQKRSCQKVSACCSCQPCPAVLIWSCCEYCACNCCECTRHQQHPGYLQTALASACWSLVRVSVCASCGSEWPNKKNSQFIPGFT